MAGGLPRGCAKRPLEQGLTHEWCVAPIFSRERPAREQNADMVLLWLTLTERLWWYLMRL